MRRVDWRLIPPLRAGQRSDEGLGERIAEAVERAAAGALSERDRGELAAWEARYEALTVTQCDAVGAPRVEDDPDWESRAVDEFAETEGIDVELEEYLETRRREPDCERCPYASPYSLFPMEPCEFSAGAFEEVLVDAELGERAEQAMGPGEMVALAEALEEALAAGQWRPSDVVDARDYIEKGAFFLRFWASYGFGVRPESLETPEGREAAGDDDRDGEDPEDPPPTMH